jgi:molecular chaperone DnaK
LASVKEALAGSDVEAIKTSTESLLTASQSFGQRLYEEAAKESSAAPGGEVPADEPSDDEVVDAEIVDEKS